MTQLKDSELKKTLDWLKAIGEYNKLSGRGHGDLEDACYICGLSPSELSETIENLFATQRQKKGGKDE